MTKFGSIICGHIAIPCTGAASSIDRGGVESMNCRLNDGLDLMVALMAPSQLFARSYGIDKVGPFVPPASTAEEEQITTPELWGKGLDRRAKDN